MASSEHQPNPDTNRAPDASEAPLHEQVPDSVKESLVEAAHNEAFELYARAEEEAVNRKIGELQDLINRTEAAGGRWSQEAYQDEYEKAQAATPESQDFESVTLQDEERERLLADERSAIELSTQTPETIRRLQEFREEVIWDLACRRGGQEPSPADYTGAEQEYLQIIRGNGGKYRANHQNSAQEYLLNDSFGRKIYDRVMRGGKLAKTLKIGALIGGTLLLPGVAATLGGAYLAAEGVRASWFATKGAAIDMGETVRTGHIILRAKKRAE
jgi:hypothetical protein